FHGRLGARQRDRRIVENSAMATTASVRFAGGARRSAWLHNRFRSSSARRVVATRVAIALELPAHASRTSVHYVFPDSACADNGHGVDAPGVDRRPNAATNKFWARDWLSLWLQHFGRGGWRRRGRGLSNRCVWPSRDELGCRFDGLHRRRDRFAYLKDCQGQDRVLFRADISAASGSTLSAPVASTFRQLWNGLHPSRTGSDLVPVFAFIRCFI